MTRVLVVEDEGVVAAHLQATLEKLGYDVPEPAATGDEAAPAAALTTAPPPAAPAGPFLVPTLPSPRWSGVYADVPGRGPKPGGAR